MKKLWRTILIFACAIVFGGIVTQTFATDSYQRGDIDGDGKITAADITLLARYVSKIEPIPEETNEMPLVELEDLKETYAKYCIVHNAYYGVDTLEKVEFTFYAGHVEYLYSSYAKDNYLEDQGIEETIQYNGETYYFYGAGGGDFPYYLTDEYIGIGDFGNEEFRLARQDEKTLKLIHAISESSTISVGDIFTRE